MKNLILITCGFILLSLNSMALGIIECNGKTESKKDFKAMIRLNVFGGEGATDIVLFSNEFLTGKFYSKHSLIYRPGKAPAYTQFFDAGSLRVEFLDSTHVAFNLDITNEEGEAVQQVVKKADCKITGDLYEAPIVELEAADPVKNLEALLAAKANDPNAVSPITMILKSIENGPLPREAEMYQQMFDHILKFKDQPDMRYDNLRYFNLIVLETLLFSEISDESKLAMFKPFLDDTTENNPQVYAQPAMHTLAFGLLTEKANDFLIEMIGRLDKIKDRISDDGHLDKNKPRLESDGSFINRCDLNCETLQLAIINALNSVDVAKLPARKQFVDFYFDKLVTKENRERMLDQLPINPDLPDRYILTLKVLKRKKELK